MAQQAMLLENLMNFSNFIGKALKGFIRVVASRRPAAKILRIAGAYTNKVGIYRVRVVESDDQAEPALLTHLLVVKSGFD
ncbi:hypothetical protein XI05_31235 [Bradyrhizobium sp. CCBAU 11357]|nr:hypothetical protein [Bradyrhizobium sp. CCBAU 11357]